MSKLPKADTFLCIGPEIEATVVMLSIGERAALDEGLAVALKYESQRGRLEVMKSVFKVACHYAVPCWVDKAMEMIATQYTGHDEKRVRGLAACMLTDTPWTPNYGCDAMTFTQDAKGVWSWKPTDTGKGNGGGNGKAKLDPPKPVKPRPGGAAAKLVYEKGNGKVPSKSKSKKQPARVPVSIR